MTSEPATIGVDILPRDADGRVRPFTPEELLGARRPMLEDVLRDAIDALRLAETLAGLQAEGGDELSPAAVLTVWEVLGRAATPLAQALEALPGRLATTAIEDLGELEEAVRVQAEQSTRT